MASGQALRERPQLGGDQRGLHRGEPAAGAFAALDYPHTHEYTVLAVSGARGADGAVRLAATGLADHARTLSGDPDAAASEVRLGDDALAVELYVLGRGVNLSARDGDGRSALEMTPDERADALEELEQGEDGGGTEVRREQRSRGRRAFVVLVARRAGEAEPQGEANPLVGQDMITAGWGKTGNGERGGKREL